MSKKIEEMREERTVLERIAMLDKFKEIISIAIVSIKAHRAFRWAKAVL